MNQLKINGLTKKQTGKGGGREKERRGGGERKRGKEEEGRKEKSWTDLPIKSGFRKKIRCAAPTWGVPPDPSDPSDWTAARPNTSKGGAGLWSKLDPWHNRLDP